jgi:hypothetical protein
VAVPAHRVGTATGPFGLTGSWPTVAAWGGGLVQAALGAAAITGPSSGVLARATGVLLATLGVAWLIWGGVNLVKSRLVFAPAALAAATVSVLAMFGLLALSPARTSVFAVAAATVLLVVTGAACAIVVRRGGDRPRDVGTLRGILGMLLAAAVIAVVVTPALGATQDALLLRDDGTVPAVTHEGH